MKGWRKSFAWTLTAVFTLIAAGPGVSFAQGMMGGHMREMMQRMMGDMLPPPMDPALLPDPDSDGARLLQRYCAQCHNLPGPGLHTAAEWPAVMTRMERRMRMMSRHGMMMGRVEAPDNRRSTIILDYLQTHAQQPLSAWLSPTLESEAGRKFRTICSQCHALPDPAQHTATEWPAVVKRMKGYMPAMGKSVPKDSDLESITGFLQRHSGRNNPDPEERDPDPVAPDRDQAS